MRRRPLAHHLIRLFLWLEFQSRPARQWLDFRTRPARGWLYQKTRRYHPTWRHWLRNFFNFQDNLEIKIAPSLHKYTKWFRGGCIHRNIEEVRHWDMYHRHDRFFRLTAWFIVVYPVVWFLVLLITLPSVEMLDDPEYSLPTTLYARDGRLIQEIYVKRRKLVTFDKFPPHLLDALVAKEDSRFYEHYGVDPLRILKAAAVNIRNFRVVQGASTLTQQTAKLFFLSPERTFSRKFQELILALNIERKYTKQEILTLYLNKVNFGDAWGVEAASQVYFNKNAEDLTLNESAVLVGLLPAPNLYKPTRHPQAARKQRNIVLQRMFLEGKITEQVRDATLAEPIVVVTSDYSASEASAYYVEQIRREIQSRYGSKNLYEGGLKVYTPMNLDYQMAAHEAFIHGLEALDQRRGFRGPMEKVEFNEKHELPLDELVDLNSANSMKTGKIGRAVVTEVSDSQAKVTLGAGGEGVINWATQRETWRVAADPEHPERVWRINSPRTIFSRGDMILIRVRGQNPDSGVFDLDLYQEPLANGAVMSMDPRNGEVLAMVGGFRFGRGDGASEFIRATQALRQPGSAFKPIVYATAIDEGYTPATILDDSPRVFKLAGGKKHIPKNYDDSYRGDMTLRESLYQSRNVPTVQLVDEMGPAKVIEYARKLGFTSDIPEENIIGLGTHSVRLNELIRAYGVFANGGKIEKPRFILRVEDSKGNILEEDKQEEEQVISDATAFIITNILQDVILKPGGTANKELYDFGRPAAGKTGTTQNSTDAWFMGFIPQVVTGVYVGFDNPKVSLGPWETGGRAAAPIWKEYMNVVKSTLPIEGFQPPPSVVTLRVNPQGEFVGACDQSEGTRLEYFKASSVSEQTKDEDCRRVPIGGSSRPIPPKSGGAKPTVEDEAL